MDFAPAIPSLIMASGHLRPGWPVIDAVRRSHGIAVP